MHRQARTLIAGIILGIAVALPFGFAPSAESKASPDLENQLRVVTIQAKTFQAQRDALQHEKADKERAVMDGVPGDFKQPMYEAAKENRLPVKLIKAVCFQESDCQPGKVGGDGEIGPMQVLPETAADVAPRAGLVKYNLDGPNGITIGARYLRECIDAEGGDLWRGLAHYNRGPTWREHPEAIQYAAEVLARMTDEQ